MSLNLEKFLGKEASYLLDHKCDTVKKEHLHLPGPDFVDRVMTTSDRNPVVLRNMQTLFNNEMILCLYKTQSLHQIKVHLFSTVILF